MQIWFFATPTINSDASVSGSENAAPATEVAAVEPDVRATPEDNATDKNSQTADSDGSRLRRYLAANPMMGLVVAFRSAMLNRPIAWGPLAYSAVCGLAVSLLGCFYFRRVERTFADIV